MADLGENYTWPGVPGDAGDGLQQNWWVEAFKNEMFHLAQQKGSKLKSKVRSRSITGDATYFERFSPSDPVAKTARGMTTPNLGNGEADHSRRKVSMKDYSWGKQVDDQDKRRMLVDPISAYTKAAGMSMGRKWDDLIIGSDGAATPAIDEGMLGDAYDGTGATVAFDTTNQQIAAGGTGMTIAKLTEAKYIMDNQDVDPDGRCIVISPKALEDLLNTTEITSADYNTVRALVKGEINTFLGFDFVTSTRLPLVAAERCNVAFQKDCVGMAFCKDVTIRTGERPDLSYAMQVYAEFTANATRIDDAGVVNILCTEA
jgi:hypothetical protein